MSASDDTIETAAAINQHRVLAALPGISDSESPVRVIISAPGGPLVRTLADASRGAAMVVIGEPQAPEHTHLPEHLAAVCSCHVVAVSANAEVRHISVAADETQPERDQVPSA